jgi:pimeloyl-ACP methyl ester carboxylesterase
VSSAAGKVVFKRMLRQLARMVCCGLASILLIVLLWVCWSLVAYRDIPVADLERWYGGPDLARAEIDGVSLRYRVQGNGPPLLLLHSHYFSMRMWDDWVPLLAEHFRVIRFDMTSHGLTGPEPTADYSMARDLQLILGLLEHLGVQQFSVVGSSLGGNQAFHLAGRYPQRVEKLVLINSGGIPRPDSRAAQGTIPGWIDYLSYLVPTPAFRSFLQWMMVDDALVSDELVQEFHHMFRREGNRFAEFNRLRAFDAGDPSEVLAAVQAPVLVLWGEDNPQLPLTQIQAFERLLVNASSFQAISYAGVGHVIPLEVPQRGSRDLRQFLLSGRVAP